MPHAVFDSGTLSATGDTLSRMLVPGVDPGGSRVGQPTKPVILLRGATVELTDIDRAATANFDKAAIFLKLSQEIALDPGLLLHVEDIIAGGPADDEASGVHRQQSTYWNGSLWAAQYVGLRLDIGTLTSIRVRMHVDYEVAFVPWMDWFLMWDFLDNIVNNAREY